jgi:hypothetical protein
VTRFTRLFEFFFQTCHPVWLGLHERVTVGNLLLSVPNGPRFQLHQACLPGEMSLHVRYDMYRLIGRG